MASKLVKPSSIKSVLQRGYGAQAAAHVATRSIPVAEDVQVTQVIRSGVNVVTLEDNAPVAKISVVCKAGSRFESADNLGISHAIRRAAGLTTKGATAFGIIRTAQQNGATINVAGGREHIAYNVDVIRDFQDVGLTLLKEIASQPAFKPWEVEKLSESIALELALRDKTTMALDNVHSAAFRRGLGNSLFAPSYRSGYSHQELVDYHLHTHLSVDGMTLVGLGVDHGMLVDFATSFSDLNEVVSSPISKYRGGEVRTELGTDIAHVVVCGLGAGLKGQDILPFAVAQYALGTGSTIKYGSNSSSPLSAAVQQAGGAGVASAVNVNYSDAGLFGYSVVADASEAGNVVKAVHNAVKSASLSESEVSVAKSKLKTAILMSEESRDNTVEDIGLQILLTGNYTKPADVISKIGSVTASDVNNAIKRAFSGKLSMGAAGGLKTVPYIDEL